MLMREGRQRQRTAAALLLLLGSDAGVAPAHFSGIEVYNGVATRAPRAYKRHYKTRGVCIDSPTSSSDTFVVGDFGPG